jgi:hypothetical protein
MGSRCRRLDFVVFADVVATLLSIVRVLLMGCPCSSYRCFPGSIYCQPKAFSGRFDWENCQSSAKVGDGISGEVGK